MRILAALVSLAGIGACVLTLVGYMQAQEIRKRCCLDTKIPRTCAGWRDDGTQGREYLYFNDQGRLKRGPQCPAP